MEEDILKRVLRKRGRPRLTDEERRKAELARKKRVSSLRIVFDVEDEGIVAAIDMAADAEGITRSAWLRRAVSNELQNKNI